MTVQKVKFVVEMEIEPTERDGVVESEDIALISDLLDQGVNYLRSTSQLSPDHVSINWSTVEVFSD